QPRRWKRGILLHCVNDPQSEGHMASYIARRKFLATLGGAAVWPLAARAQQSVMPVIGFLSTNRSDAFPNYIAAFHEGLAEGGFVEGKNVATEFRFAEQHLERVPALAMDLVRRKVAVSLPRRGEGAAAAGQGGRSDRPAPAP